MNKIKVLPPHEAQKIAAGEVVERPANVLKELLENAIDAGATEISIDIEVSGKQSIRVVDNGCGLSYDDAVLCVAPHATSKISSINDLPGLTTYGFRGEALASIAAVSKFSITTRDTDQAHAWQLHFVEGRLNTTERIAAPQGTTVEVKELFYNIPVRKKFLKQDETEWNQIVQLIHAIALSHLSIGFKLKHNNRPIIQAPRVASLPDRIAQLWGTGTAQQFLFLTPKESSSIQIDGLITSHQSWRYGKHQIFYFVNERWVKDAELVKALLKGYNAVLPPGRFPAGIINITVDATFIDVNVHPKKEEVRFAKPQTVCIAITDAVQATLRANTLKGTNSTWTPKPISAPSSEHITLDSPITRNIPPLRSTPPAFQALGNVFAPRESNNSSNPLYPIHSTKKLSLEPNNIEHERLLQFPVEHSPQSQDFFAGKIIGQILRTYLVVELNKEVVFIDQHAAHERILYERMKDRVVARESSLLIFPITLMFTSEELEALEKFETLFLDFGITCNRMGPGTLAIKATPLGITHIDLENLLRQAAILIIEQEDLDFEIVQKALFEHAHSHLACKRAVKAGDELTHEQMERLLLDLATVEKPFICIHGRPTHWRLGQNELERFFRR